MSRKQLSVAMGWAALTLLSVWVACTQTVTNAVAVAIVEVVPAQADVGVGQTLQLTVRLQDKDGHVLSGREVTWSSSNSGVASVDAQGLVQGEAVGQASVQARSGGISGSATVSVTALQAVRVDPDGLSFSAPEGGADPAPQTVSVTSTGAAPVSGLNIAITYGTGEPGNWLNASLSSTTTPLTLTLSATVAALSVGTYHATVEVRSLEPGARAEPVAVILAVGIAPPAAPSDLRAVPISSSRVDLAWQDNSSDETEFRIERRTGTSGAWSPLATVAANSSTYTDNGVAPSTAYQYRVQACAAAGCSAYSSEATADTPAHTDAPAAPSGLVAAPASALQINLSWQDNSNNEAEFRIEQRPTSGSSWTQVGTVGANSTSYAATGLTVATSYTFRVRACNVAGCSPYSAETTATTLDLAPTAPSDLTAVTVSTTEIDLSWTDNSTNEMEFRVERNAGAGWATVTSTTANTTSYQDTGLTPSTTYDYRVAACNTSGCSGYSNTATSSTGTPVIALTPTSLMFSATVGDPTDPPSQPVAVTNGGAGTLSGLSVGDPVYGAGQPTGWLTTHTIDGPDAPATVTLAATLGALAAGTYTATVEVASTVPGVSPQTITVTFEVAGAAPSIVLTPTSVTFSATEGDLTDPPSQPVAVTNGGGGILTGLSVGDPVYGPGATGWLTTHTIDGPDAPATVTLGVTLGALAAGTYTATVEVASTVAGVSPQTIDVTFTVAAPAPSIVLTPTSVTFSATEGDLTDPASQTVAVTNGGGGILTGLSVGDPVYGPGATGWLTTHTIDGPDAPATVTLGVTLGALAAGTYTATVEVASSLPGVSPQTIDVTFDVAAPSPAPPSDLTATAVSASEIDLDWSDNSSNENAFRIERSEHGNDWTLLVSLPANTISYKDTGLHQKTTYTYRLQACGSGGCSSYSNTAAATTQARGGSEDASLSLRAMVAGEGESTTRAPYLPSVCKARACVTMAYPLWGA